MIRTLFVCTGNTCRSPMAAALLQNKINSASAGTAYSVASAGLAAWPGQPASPEAVLVMGQRGLSLAGHSARQIDFDQISASRIVLTMTRAHKEVLLRLFPAAQDKIFTLAEYTGGQVDVTDPIGGTLQAYHTCADQLTKLIERAWDKIYQLAGKTG